jgi:hypothetical protein
MVSAMDVRLAVRMAPVAASLLLSASCSWLVYQDIEQAEPACEGAADCFAGFACVDGVCTEVSPPDDPPPVPAPVEIGSSGGEVTGPDGVLLIVPAGALGMDTLLRVEHGTPSLVPDGFVDVTAFYDVVPADVGFAVPATLEIPVAGGRCDGDCSMWRRSDGAWELSSVPSGGAGTDRRVRGGLRGGGTFVVGTPMPDAGSPDAGHDAGPGDAGVDAGPADAGYDGGGDAGQPTPSFAACALTPDSCSGGEACWPDPFSAGSGFCLRACSLGAADCDCCATLPNASEPLCLPQALCGSASFGAACPQGTSDCDPMTTDGCVDVGDGPVCSRACDEPSDCGTGCCATGVSGGELGSFCLAADDCGAGDDGALCLDDAACSSGACGAPDGLAVDRCTQACDPSADACGDGLCCYPTNCAGGGMCVPDVQCADASSLLCDDLCLDDSACGQDAWCIDGACTAKTCDCLVDAQCGAQERCDLSTPSCGACVALASEACTIDAHCPPAGTPDARLCRVPDCGSPPCIGTCGTPGAGECVNANDCVPGQACVANRCL